MRSETEHNSCNQLVSRYQNGDAEALKLLIHNFHPKMIRFIHYQAGNGSPVEDLAQDCWFIIINKMHSLNLRISFEAWAFTIAKRKSIDWIREQQRIRDRNQELATETESTEAKESVTASSNTKKIEMIRAGIEELPPTQKIVTRMFYLENLRLNEISDALNISSGTVKSRLFHERENLKKIINP